MKELVPEAPAVSNFITGEVMGHSADRLAAKFGITRRHKMNLQRNLMIVLLQRIKKDY